MAARRREQHAHLGGLGQACERVDLGAPGSQPLALEAVEGVATGEHKAATCAATSLADLERPLDRRWLERLARSSAGFPRDAPPDALARIAALPQFA